MAAFARTFSLIAVLFYAGIATAHSSAGFLSAAQAFQAGEFEEAIAQFEELSAAGDAKAKSFLGYLYGHGIFVEKDLEKAFHLSEIASRKGDAEAHFNAAVLYQTGRGVPPSLELAARHFRAAANAGHPKAQFFLGSDYYLGEGVPEDPERAHQWLKRSLDNGHTPALSYVIQHPLLSGAKDPDYGQIAADLLAETDQGLSGVYFTLGLMYGGGLGVEEDRFKALQWLQLAAILGHLNATVSLRNHLTKYKFDNQTRSLAAYRSRNLLLSAANREDTYIGRASRWCQEDSELTLECVVKAISHHEECEAPFFPGLFDGYVKSEAYKYCRRKLFKESRRKLFNESGQE